MSHYVIDTDKQPVVVVLVTDDVVEARTTAQRYADINASDGVVVVQGAPLAVKRTPVAPVAPLDDAQAAAMNVLPPQKSGEHSAQDFGPDGKLLKPVP